MLLSRRRRQARKVARIARVLAALEADAGLVRPVPRRAPKVSLGA
jgi:hypothetical protein